MLQDIRLSSALPPNTVIKQENIDNTTNNKLTIIKRPNIDKCGISLKTLNCGLSLSTKQSKQNLVNDIPQIRFKFVVFMSHRYQIIRATKHCYHR